FSHVSQQRSESLFSFCYTFCLTFSDAHYSVIAYAVASRDAIHTGVRLGEFSGDGTISFWARAAQDFAGVATLVAIGDEPLTFQLAVIVLAHVQSNRYPRFAMNAMRLE